MLQRLIIIIVFQLPLWGFAQVVRDDTNFQHSTDVIEDLALKVSDLRDPLISTDSVNPMLSARLDSLERSATSTYSSLKNKYDSVINIADVARSQFQKKIDTLQSLRLPTIKFSAKVDSIDAWKNAKMKTITSRVDSLTNGLRNKIESLELPPELAAKAQQLTSKLNKLDITLPDSSLPKSFQQKLNVEIPNLAKGVGALDIHGQSPVDLPKLSDLANGALPSADIGNLGNQASQYQNEISKMPTDLDGAAKFAEDQVSNISVIGDVQKELTQVEEVTKVAGTLKDQEQLKQQVVSEVKEQAMDHFAGKQEQLTKAMETVSKYKSRFPTTTSMIDLPKKPPNAMKKKPLIERIVPGIAFQLQKKNDDLLVDINPYLAYRFTTRFSTGAGWNQRIAYNTDSYAWSSKDSHVYGPRLFGEYKLGRGFSPRLEIEVMNALVPPYIKTTPQDLGSREWVWGAFVGIKKDYKFMKKIKGTTMIMFRLFDPHRKSPYADVVNARFGFEFPIKKKQRKKNT